MPPDQGFHGCGEPFERGKRGVAAQKELPNRRKGGEIPQPRPGPELDPPDPPSGREEGGIPLFPSEEKEKVADASSFGDLLRKRASSQENGPGSLDGDRSPAIRSLVPS